MYFITHLEQGVVFFLSFSRNFSPNFQGIIESTHDYNTRIMRVLFLYRLSVAKQSYCVSFDPQQPKEI